ncbi:MAG: 16S rRNA (cytidine(1402)-2'-O)-methyltransferase [Candidatus Shapirobacteria bacterium]
MATLFLVSTPIGNLADITLRAKEVLATVDFIICEDTRKTGFLLQKLGFKSPPLYPFYEENESRQLLPLLTKLQSGQSGALVSDAGTPTLADPGYKLVRECLKSKVTVVPIPGPSAALAALVASGLPTDKFIFFGYLPEKIGKKEKLLRQFAVLPATIIIYEAPHRLVKTLKFIQQVLGDLDLVIANELTKKFEKFYRDKTSTLVKLFETHKPRGEYVILFHS